MKEWQEMLMAVSKPGSEQSVTRPCRSSRGGEGDGVKEEIEAAPGGGGVLEGRFELAGDLDVAGEDEVAVEGVGYGADVGFGFGVEVGGGEAGAGVGEDLGAAGGDAVVVGDAEDKAAFAGEV